MSPTPAGNVSTTTAPSSYPDWEYQVLAGLGNTTPSAAQLQALSLWQQSDGTNPNQYNWLATSLKGSAYPTSGVIATNGGNAIPAYASQAVGVAATVATIKGSFPAIAVVLGKGNTVSLQGIFAVINASSWCKGCQGGLYPVALADFINARPGTFPGGAVPAGTAPNNSAPTAGTCVWNLPVVGCVLTVSEAKALLGGVMVALGVGGLALGGILVVAFGLTGSRAGRQATNVAAKVPGPIGGAARGVKGITSSSPRRSSSPGTRVTPPAAPTGAHAAQGRHAPGASSRVPVRQAVSSHNADEMERDRALRGFGRAQDRRNAAARRRGEIVSETR